MKRGAIPIRGYGERWMVGRGSSYEGGRRALGGNTESF